jgi:hypothetical protein
MSFPIKPTLQQLLESAQSLPIADAPAQGRELKTFGDLRFETPTPGQAPVLSLKGRWVEASASRRGCWLSIEPEKLPVDGMSGSPIVSMSGEQKPTPRRSRPGQPEHQRSGAHGVLLLLFVCAAVAAYAA